MNLNRLRSLVAGLCLELHPLTLGQRSVPSHLDLGLMDEHIWSSVVGHDEPVPLFGVEPLDDTSSHEAYPFDFMQYNHNTTPPNGQVPESARRVSDACTPLNLPV